MASTVGMTIRTSKANERIDAALATLAAGSNAPEAPDKGRDSMLNDVLRLEWIADTLEAMAAEPHSKYPPPEVTPTRPPARKSTAKAKDA